MMHYYRRAMFILGDDKRFILPMLFLYLATLMLDLVGIGLIGPFVGLIQDSSALDNSGLWQKFSSYFGVEGHIPELSLLGGVVIAIFIFKGWASFRVQKAVIAFGFDLQVRLRCRLMETYQKLPYTFHLSRNSASLINVMQSHTTQYAKGVVAAALRLVGECITSLGIVLFLLYSYPGPTLIVVTLLSILGFFYDRLVRNKVRTAGAVVADASESMIKGTKQAVDGLKEIRVLGSDNYFHSRVQSGAQQLSDASILVAVLQLLPKYLIETIMVIVIVGLSLTVLIEQGSQAAVLPTLAIFAMAGIRLMPSANQIVSAISNMRYSSQFVDQLYEDLAAVEDLPNKNAFSSVTPEQKKPVEPFDKIQFKNISYRYPGTDQTVIDDLSFEIEHGQSIGIIGPSGSGKTTLADLLLGLLTPSDGSIQVDGRNIHENLADWRMQTAYIPQGTLMIDDSLRRNIALGVEDADIDDDRLIKSLETAQLANVVTQLPDGVMTMMGENGTRLSGGQRQRCALARAFYHQRNLIVMDEATSALDTETEEEIVKAINGVKGRTTLVVIAHRLSTVRDCDRIIRLVDGKLMASGSYQEVVGD